MRNFIFGFLVSIIFIPTIIYAAPAVKYVLKIDYDNKIKSLETRIKNLESRPAIIVKDSDSTDLESKVSELKTRFESHQSCLRLWSIGNDFMPADDVWHCSNK